MGTDHLRLSRTDLRVGVTSWWSAAEAVAAEVFTDGEDVHANRAETSLMLAVAPHLVSLEMLAESDDPDRTRDLVFRYTARELSTNGVTGRPSEADADLGRRLFEVAVEAVVDMVQKGRAEVPPLVARAEPTPERAAASRHLQLAGTRAPLR